MHQIEKEFKNLLNEYEYERLYEQYQAQFSPVQQHINTYFDDRGLLQKARCALRIRLIQGDSMGELTLKVPHCEHELSEYTQLYPIETLHDWIAAKAFPIPTAFQTVFQSLDLDVHTVFMTAQLQTERYETRLNSDVLLVLDKSTYGTTTDFELEMEVGDTVSGAAFFANFLQEHQIEVRPTKNKIVRALEAVYA